ncbi:hypothetical protein CVT26_015541 [Gymnopilus dilepis]|uniref:Uncharacterized protein n=1 Tax=Gymnopilus dilepis TaxID=231916 RepID=A0A409YD48_9AGAR|nr:hypothetical protein CVT26_015541 [Gymnopilus dilepis]
MPSLALEKASAPHPIPLRRVYHFKIVTSLRFANHRPALRIRHVTLSLSAAITNRGTLSGHSYGTSILAGDEFWDRAVWYRRASMLEGRYGDMGFPVLWVGVLVNAMRFTRFNVSYSGSELKMQRYGVRWGRPSLYSSLLGGYTTLSQPRGDCAYTHSINRTKARMKGILVEYEDGLGERMIIRKVLSHSGTLGSREVEWHGI